MQDVQSEVQKYSVMVGFILILVFVVPCITLALVAKYFQKQSSSRKHSTIRNIMGSIRINEEKSAPDSDTSGLGTFGLVEVQTSQLEYLERIVSPKYNLGCIETWKAYAPPLSYGPNKCRKLVAVRKPSTNVQSRKISNESSRENHTACLKPELLSLSHIPPHHFILNLLGLCNPNYTSVTCSALIMEYPLYGALQPFLVCKRRGYLSNNSSQWAGLEHQNLEDNVIRALPDDTRCSLTSLLDDYDTRSQPFKSPLNVHLSDLDVLLFGLQIASGMNFLTNSGIIHKYVSTDNTVISTGFYLKLSGLASDIPVIHRKTSSSQLRRNPSGRNTLKWDAPEIIDGKEYTDKSQVWKFGMILWEICSLGDTPFAEVPGRTLVEEMKKGELPRQPEGCSDELYSLMRSCWNFEAASRPTFSYLVEVILELLKLHDTTSKSFELNPGIPRRRPSIVVIQRNVPRSLESYSSVTSDKVLLGDSTPSPSPELHSYPSGYNETDV